LTGAVLTALDHIIYRARNIVVPPDFIPTLRNLRFRKALHTLDEVVYGLITSRRKSGQLGEDLLGMLLNARDEESGLPMTDLQVRDEVLTMLIAGHETVASALTWTWYLLAGQADARESLRNEVTRVVGSRLPVSADLPDLVFTGQIFSEALRLYPPAWVISRKAIEADDLLGYSVPVGALMIISPYVIHRLPNFWEDPESFRPARFSRDNEAKQNRFSYLPFGAGPRLCIGSNFATIEALLIMTMITQRFWLEQVSPAKVRMDALVTLRPRDGMPMLLHAY
jgi:cytochrome P450